MATTAPVASEKPQHDHAAKPPVRRQLVAFTFYKVMPEWRRLPAETKVEHKRAFVAVIDKWKKPGECISITYSVTGTRGDADFCLWTICYSVDEINQMRAELISTPLGGYLLTPHNFLSMTKRSLYQIDHESAPEDDARGAIRPGGQKYNFIYPFVKTRPWYLLPLTERKRLMDEHIRVGLKYPRVKLNTTYSFGIDDQDFVVAFESNYPEDFVDLVQELRETEASMYTERDTPMFCCVRMSPAAALDQLG